MSIFIVNLYAGSLSNIPNEYKDDIKIFEPKNNLITINDSLKIKGRVKSDVNVTINNQSVTLDRNNQFNHTISINKLGKQNINIEFDVEGKKINIEKNIIKLKNPNNIIMSQKELAFINTTFTSNKIKSNPLSNKFKKNEFAYFLNKIKTTESVNEKKINNMRSIKLYKTAIQETVDSNILSLNAKGNFNVNGEINTLFFLTGIARALDYEPSSETYPEIEQHKNKWFYNFLKIGLDKKIITVSDIRKVRKTLSNADFIKLATKIPELNKTIESQLVFDEQESLIKENSKKTSKKSVKSNLNVLAIRKISDKAKVIHGVIKPVKPFVLNWKKVTPDKNGYFTAKVPVSQETLYINTGNEIIAKNIVEFNQPKNEIAQTTKSTITTYNKNETINTTKVSIEPYADLKSHWINQIANELKIEGKLDDSENFNPNKSITRADLAKYLVKINGVPSKPLEKQSFNDLDKANPNYKYIKTVVSNKLLNGISNSTFAPNWEVTKIQAIIAASRMLPDSNKYKNIKLPYSDIKKYKWAEESLQKAYYYRIISKAPKLFPKKNISNAELVSLLYKTSKI